MDRVDRTRIFQIHIDRVRQRLATDKGRHVTVEQAEVYLLQLGFRRRAAQWTGPALAALQLRGDEYCVVPESGRDLED